MQLAISKGFDPRALTLGETLELAAELKLPVSDVVIAEAGNRDGLTPSEVLDAVEKAFEHNLQALETGLTTGSSFLFGTVAQELAEHDFGKKLFEDDFINRALVYTLAAQIGNHTVGLNPCAGTGDACPYTGLLRAIMETEDREQALRAAAVMLKVGTMFQAGKTTTGCNMEGLGAGAAAVAAALVELGGGSPATLGRAVVLALSPTIAVPCTPRVMVAGLCATHIGVAILDGALAARLALLTNIPVMVPVDVMIAMAGAVHPISADSVVPVVIEYLQPFFKVNPQVEAYTDSQAKSQEAAATIRSTTKARDEARCLARTANPITAPFGEVVVGGSSQAVGSPANAARIAHELARGRITRVIVELAPELFVRRGINVPSILMAAVYGAHTGDSAMYGQVMDRLQSREVAIEVVKAALPHLQRITIEATEGGSMVDAFNQGGGRLIIRDARPSRAEALAAAKRLNIVVVSEKE